MEFNPQQLDWLIAGIDEVITNTEYMLEISDNPQSWRKDLKGLRELKEMLERQKKRKS